MSDTKLCPYVSTIQVVPLQLQGVTQPVQTQTIDPAALKSGSPLLGPTGQAMGALGAAMASGVSQVQAGFAYKTKPGSTQDNPQFLGDALSAPCMREQCEKWCARHEATRCGSGCDACQVEIMTQAFTAALKDQGESLGLAAARKLLDKAHENFEENPV